MITKFSGFKWILLSSNQPHTMTSSLEPTTFFLFYVLLWGMVSDCSFLNLKPAWLSLFWTVLSQTLIPVSSHLFFLLLGCLFTIWLASSFQDFCSEILMSSLVYQYIFFLISFKRTKFLVYLSLGSTHSFGFIRRCI